MPEIENEKGNWYIRPIGDLVIELQEWKIVKGLPEIHTEISYGSMYAEDATQTISVAAVHTHYPVAGGLSAGLCSAAFTFQSSKELKCHTAGKYLATWSMSISNNAADQTIEGLVMVNTTGMENTINATRAKESAVVYSISGSGIITLAVNDVVLLAIEKENGAASTVTMNHANLTLMRVG